jgi:hypothetical protein
MTDEIDWVWQQEKALECTANLRVLASEVRQMGFKNLGKEYKRQAKAAEK